MIQGKIAAKSGKGDGIKIGEQWYNANASIFAGVNRGDTIQFEEQWDGSRFIVTAPPVVTAKAQAGGGGYGKSRGGGGYKKDPRAQYGPIVGHSFMVAATLLQGTNPSVDMVTAKAKEVMRASEGVLQEVLAKVGGSPTPVPQTPQAAPQAPVQPQYQPAPQSQPPVAPVPAVDDDIPF